jgi:uncharacterized protein (DUF697 family)
MSRKKLPSAIVRTSDMFPPATRSTGMAAAAQTRPVDASRPVTESATVGLPGGNVVQLVPEVTARRQEAASIPPASAPRTSGAVRRRARALAIVNRHTAYSAIGGLVPLPLLNLAGVTAIIVRMVKVLSHHYRVPFERDRARAIVVGLIGGVMPTGAAVVATSALSTVLPPVVLTGMAISCATAATFTHGVGRIFIEHFESGATLSDFPAAGAG